MRARKAGPGSTFAIFLAPYGGRLYDPLIQFLFSFAAVSVTFGVYLSQIMGAP